MRPHSSNPPGGAIDKRKNGNLFLDKSRDRNSGCLGTGTMSQIRYGDVSWERMIRAVEKVRQRVLRAASALEKAAIPYAVAGGNAVAAARLVATGIGWTGVRAIGWLLALPRCVACGGRVHRLPMRRNRLLENRRPELA